MLLSPQSCNTCSMKAVVSHGKAVLPSVYARRQVNSDYDHPFGLRSAAGIPFYLGGCIGKAFKLGIRWLQRPLRPVHLTFYSS